MPAFLILQQAQWFCSEGAGFFFLLNVHDFFRKDRNHHTVATRWTILSAKDCMEALQYYSISDPSGRDEIKRRADPLRLHVSWTLRAATSTDIVAWACGCIRVRETIQVSNPIWCQMKTLPGGSPCSCSSASCPEVHCRCSNRLYFQKRRDISSTELSVCGLTLHPNTPGCRSHT